MIAVLIGLSISEPIVMLIYSSEIAAQISQDQAADRASAAIQVNHDPRYSLELAPYAQVLAQATKSQQQASKAVIAANKALDAEEGGYGGTHDVGVGSRSANGALISPSPTGR